METVEKQITLSVDLKQTGEPLGDFYGIFFEDINHAADGGLYAEMVQNRDFEFCPIDNGGYRSLTAWEKVEEDGRADWMISSREPVSDANPHYLVLNVTRAGKRVGARNLGYHGGMAVDEGKEYQFSCYARCRNANLKVVRAALTDPRGEVICEACFTVGESWERYELLLVPSVSELHGRLELWVEETGILELDFVSLMPADTFLGRKNGMRKDIARLLADLKPRFMRFPGGCLVHDGALEARRRDSMYRWKNTIGDLTQRPGRRNNWGYHQSYGIGFLEYFQFCEDIGAQPLPVLPGGYNPHSGEAVPLEELGPWVQDALDLIEFANGDADTEWGGLRTRMGHPKPFGLKYLAIGNEEAGAAFWERYEVFHRAIRETYPEVQIINSAGPFCAGEAYEMGWKSARENGSDLVDEHYYQAPEWFIANHHHYDSYKGPAKVFLGEYASCGNTWYNALAEASYMIGLERNAKGVGLACYAPLLCNAAYVNWRPDLIWFDHHRVYGSASYYVQKLFMNHQGDEALSVEADGVDTEIPMEAYPDHYDGMLWLAGYGHAETLYRDVVLENLDTGESRTWTRAIAPKGKKLELGQYSWTNFRLSFKARQPGRGVGFDLYLGYQDEENHFVLNFGGWANQDLFFTHRIRGAGSTLDQASFHVEADREYEVVTEVHGRRTQVWADGRKMLDRDVPPMNMEALYYTAGKTRDGEIIVKLVNVTKETRNVRILLKGCVHRNVVVHCMEGFADEDENSFEEPCKVSPKSFETVLKDGILEFIMPGRALRICQILA